MATATQSRVIRSGPYLPTVPRSGSEGDNVIWRKRNLITRGRNGRYYEEVIGGPLELDMSCPLVELTGTVSIVQGSATVTGTGTLFHAECHLGQRILIIDEDDGVSILLVPKRIISDTEMEIWQDADKTHPYISLSAQTAWRMYRLFAVNDQVGALLWGNLIELDKGSLLSAGDGEFLLDGAVFTGTRQVETATVVGTIDVAGAGDVETVVTAAGMTGSPVTVLTAVANSDTASDVAGKIRADLALDPDVSSFFSVSGAGDQIILTALVAAANDATMNIATDNDTSTGLTPQPTSVDTTPGISDADAILTATREPQISIFNPTQGTYANYTLGMDTPSGITAAAVGGGTKGMQGGNYSYVVTPGRSATAGYNNPSERIDVTLATDDMVELTFGPMDTANGSDQWDIWGTTFAASLTSDLNYLNGPWHYVRSVTSAEVDPAGGTFRFEYLDAEIEGNELVSFDNDPPPQAEFIELLNFTPVWLSCRGAGYVTGATTVIDPAPGPFIAPAKPNNIEAAPAGIQFASSPPETIIGAVSAQGRIFLLTTNHLEIAQSTPDESIPILIRPFWNDGFANPEQVVFLNGTLYGYPVSGPSRSAGDGDKQESEKDWAADVAELIKRWNPGHVLVAYEPFYDCIAFFHIADRLNEFGFWTTRYLMYSPAQQMWVGDGEFTQSDRDSIISGVATVGEQLRFIMGGRRVG